MRVVAAVSVVMERDGREDALNESDERRRIIATLRIGAILDLR